MSRRKRDRPSPKAEATRSDATNVSHKATSIVCPDCGATKIGNRMEHSPTCPLWLGVNRAVDDDAEWFRQHPGSHIRERRITPAEQAEFEMSAGWRPGTLVVVVQLQPGVRIRKVSESRFGAA